MNILKNKKIFFSIIFVTILVIILSSIIINMQNKEEQKQINIVVANILGEIKEKYPETDESILLEILNMDTHSIKEGSEILSKYGIDINEISTIKSFEGHKNIITNIIIIVSFAVLILVIIIIYENRKNKKIKEIVNYIEAISNKNYNLKIEENSEDEFSNLTNQLYKITVMLKEQADNSIKDKKALQTSLEDISHQLKTPLTSISIMLDNIRENPNMEASTRQAFIHEINRQIEWINWLVISLLKLSKLASNTAIFTKREIVVKELIEDVIHNLSIPIDIKQQNIVVTGKENVKLIGDYNWQLEAITNILKNCIEHTPENKNIYIDFSENNFYTKITIRDEGIGIDKQDVKHIFERFYKGKNSSENSVGIGLALAKSIIEKDNGYITCSSKLNEGAIFEIKYMK